MKNISKIIIVGLIFLGLIIGSLYIISSNSTEKASSGIIVAIAPNGTYEYISIGDDPIPDERMEYLTKEAMNGKGDNITITNGTIYGEKVTIKDLSIYRTPITLAYFKGNNTPPFDGDTFSAIVKFSYVVATLRLTESTIDYQVAIGSLTTEEGEKKSKNQIEQSLNDFKEKFPEITVSWDKP